MAPPTERPTPPNLVADTYVPPNSRKHPVQTGENWGSFGMPAWDLIEFNFPGIDSVKRVDFQRATRQVNWYLENYVGCSKVVNDNYAFSSGLSSRGRGSFRDGHIFLPVAPVVVVTPGPPTPPSCTAITIDLSFIPAPLKAILSAFGVSIPTRARCLDPTEEAVARGVYGASLAYNDIYISDGTGGSGRPATAAVPEGSRWIVILNVGSAAYSTVLHDKVTLIHELAHAWQSQHHREPWRFMINCLKSQAFAAAETQVAKARKTTPGKAGTALLGPLAGYVISQTDEADAYSYVPGKRFFEYGGEQIAQQIEDHYANSSKVNAAQRPLLQNIITHVSSVATGARDSWNEQSLSEVRVARKGEAGVVWHD